MSVDFINIDFMLYQHKMPAGYRTEQKFISHRSSTKFNKMHLLLKFRLNGNSQLSKLENMMKSSHDKESKVHRKFNN